MVFCRTLFLEKTFDSSTIEVKSGAVGNEFGYASWAL
jgi:hypothetical protein